MYDVIIVGGGPVGSHTAAKLAAMGHKVAVLERRQQCGGKACTGIISSECMRAFSIDEKVVLRRVNSARLVAPSGKSVELRREKTQACVVDRLALERLFVQRAVSSGSEYLPDTFVTKVQVGHEEVRVQALVGDKTVVFEGKAVVIASGFATKMVESLGLGRYADVAVGVQAVVDTNDIDEIEVYFGKSVAPGFFGWLVPTRPGQALVGLLTREKPQTHLSCLVSKLVSDGKVRSADVEVISAGIPLKPLSRTYGKRVIAVGDAAGQVKPTTCGGIYYGLLCADIAAATLHEAISRGDFSARVLSCYERLWRQKLSNELEVDYYARKFFERLSDGRIDHLFEVVADYGIAESLLRAEDLSFDWHSTAILRLMSHRVMSRALSVMRMPFRLGSEI